MEVLNTSPAPIISRMITQRDTVIDENLPSWARRSNPIVRRELGENWKRLFPNLTFIAKFIAFQMVAVFISPLAFLMTFTLPVAVLAVVLTPAILFLYGRVIITAIHAGAESMVSANMNHTLDLLRVSPIPLKNIILGKVAASIWRRMDDLDMVLMGATLFCLPFLSIYYMGGLQTGDVLFGHRLMVIIGLAVIPLRLMLEPFMFATIAVAVGSILPTRAAAVATTITLAIFYYIMLTVPLMANAGWILRIMFEVLIPLALPLIFIYTAIRFAHWRIEQQ